MEVAPGILVSDLALEGWVYIFHAAAFGIENLGDRGKLILIHPDDWDRLPKDDRERLADQLTRDSAQRGMMRLEQWLERMQSTKE